MKGHKLTVCRVVLIGVVIVLPILFLLYQAFFNPKIPFLPPSTKARWVISPEQLQINWENHGKVKKVEFKKEFNLESLPSSAEMRVRIRGNAQILVNGIEVERQSPTNWKRNSRISLTPHLRQGANRLDIRVVSKEGMAAICVEEPDYLRTPSDWSCRVIASGTHGRYWAVYDAAFDPFKLPVIKQGLLQEWSGWRWMKWVVGAWIISAIGLAGWVSYCAVHVQPPIDNVTRSAPRWMKWTIPVGILVVCGALNGWVAWHSHFTREKFDSVQHLKYIKFVASNWKVPSATDGPMMYHPPLYYYSAAVIYHLCGDAVAPKGIQYLGVLMGFGLVLVTWLCARQLFPRSNGAQWVALGFAAFLPMSLYKNSQITNEVFASAVIGVTFFLLLRWGGRGEDDVGKSGFTGIVGRPWVAIKSHGFIRICLRGALVGDSNFNDAAKAKWASFVGLSHRCERTWRPPFSFATFGSMGRRLFNIAIWKPMSSKSRPIGPLNTTCNSAKSCSRIRGGDIGFRGLMECMPRCGLMVSGLSFRRRVKLLFLPLVWYS